MTENNQMSALSNRIDEFRKAYEELQAAKDRVAELQKICDQCKTDLATEMVSEEITLVSRGGYSYSAVPKTRFSKRAGADEALFEALRARGLGDIIRESVSPQTLQATIKELVDNTSDGEVPDDLSELINRYDYVDIQRRKKS